jgi:hypothetical protein
VKNFILNQEGSSIIYNESNSLIVENGYFTQEIFSPKDFVIVTSGLETFPSLCKIDSFNLNETALFFINPARNPINFFTSTHPNTATKPKGN